MCDEKKEVLKQIATRKGTAYFFLENEAQFHTSFLLNVLNLLESGVDSVVVVIVAENTPNTTESLTRTINENTSSITGIAEKYLVSCKRIRMSGKMHFKISIS